jgi:diguanylate cyclase (GGDEF)-like protein
MITTPQSVPSPGVQRILVVGGGRGGSAMLDLFSEDVMIDIVGIFDADPQAPALEVARKLGIRDFNSLADAVEASRPCLVFNLTGDESVTAYVEAELGRENIIGGFQARFLWNLLTRLKRTNEQIAHLAYHDTLTSLPNRILFYDRLNQAITKARREKESVAVLFLDLDGFKAVNDTYGHGVGDALLREAARRITACVRDSDTVARLGGDEFTILLTGIRTPTFDDRVARQIIDTISHPFTIHGKTCAVSVSIGIALYPDHGDTAEQLVKISDAAMYIAKRNGKNCYCMAQSTVS